MIERKPFTPRPYQSIAVDHLIDVPRCALWAGMGLGKTVSTLTALDLLFMSGETHPALVLAPLRVARKTWPDEARKWSHLRNIDVMPIVGNEAERLMALRYDASVYTCNYENLPWLIEHYGERWPFATLIPDEATRLKSLRLSYRTHPKTGKVYLNGQGGKRARALGKIAHTHIKRTIQLTGTPSPNGLIDLWGQVWFLDAGQRLGRTFDAYKNRFFRPSFNGFGVEPLPHAQEQIQDALRDICLTIDAKDWFNIEEPIVNNVYVDLPARARKLYHDMEKEMYMKIDSHEIEAHNAAAKTQKLLQVCNGAAYLDIDVDSDGHPKAREWKEIHDVKLDALDSIVTELNGAPLLVAYQFKSDLARLKRAFPKFRALVTTQDEDDFKAGKLPGLFVHPASAGHGIDGFQNACNNIALFGHDWNLENFLQIIERIGPVRQIQAGFERPVFIHNIIARDTVDELVIARRETKREVQDLLLDAMKRRM